MSLEEFKHSKVKLKGLIKEHKGDYVKVAGVVGVDADILLEFIRNDKELNGFLKKTRILLVVREYAEAIIIAFVLAMIIRTFVIQAFKIPTGSMKPTLMVGDRILVNKFIYRFKEPERGDVIVFKYPEDPKKDFIKRVIGKPGETVQIVDGNIWINGEMIETPEQIRKIHYYNQGKNGRGSIVVPEDSYFVLGDNSYSSRDSRYWGFVSSDKLLGKALVIYWPFTRLRKIE